ncbi:MAG: DegT/DnrJ/EryC1/StrS family aminotransferase [Candidatus Firestonebacteria bacterium]
MKRIRLVTTHLKIWELIYYTIKSLNHRDKYYFQLINQLKEKTNSKYCYLFSSGTAAFSIALESLKRLSNKQEVIIPAYTPLILIVKIQENNLKPIPCDISLKTLSFDESDFNKKVNSQNTLCAAYVRLFGIYTPISTYLKIAKENKFFLLEDDAQSFIVNTKEQGDIILFSFKRGKNFTTFSGGVLLGNDEKIFESIYENYNELKNQSTLIKLYTFIKFLAFIIIKNKYLYSIFSAVIKKFKDIDVPKDLRKNKYTNWQASVGLRLLEKIDKLNKTRHENTERILQSLNKYDVFQMPEIDPLSNLNRFPLIIKDVKLKEKIIKNLTKSGIEVSDMYNKTLPYIFNLGYNKEDFPNAYYLADRIITLPVHPLATSNDIDFMIEEIKKCFQ